MDSRPLITDCLKILNVIGLRPYKNTPWQNIRKFVTLFAIYLTYVDVLLVTVVKWNGIESFEDVLTGIAMNQLMFKISMLLIKREELISVLSDVNKFWKVDKYGFEQKERNEKIFSTIKISLRSFLSLLLVLLLTFSVKPFLSTENELPFASLLFGSSELIYFKLASLYQVATMIIIVFVQVGFDGLYISLITNIICELKLIKVGFRNIHINEDIKGTEKRTMDELKELVDHHNLILKAIKGLKNMYSIIFMCLFLINMLGICFCLLCIIINGTFRDMASFFSYGTSTFLYVIQLFFYCAPGTNLVEECLEISDVVYQTDWCVKTQPELRKAYVRIIQRANNPETLTAGGMVDVNLETFTAVLQNAMSFFTFVQAAYEDL